VRIVWTSSAVLDLEQISDYLLENHPELATTIIERIFKSVSELKLFPARGRPGVGETIRVLRVLHGARRWPE